MMESEGCDEGTPSSRHISSHTNLHGICPTKNPRKSTPLRQYLFARVQSAAATTLHVTTAAPTTSFRRRPSKLLDAADMGDSTVTPKTHS